MIVSLKWPMQKSTFCQNKEVPPGVQFEFFSEHPCYELNIVYTWSPALSRSKITLTIVFFPIKTLVQGSNLSKYLNRKADMLLIVPVGNCTYLSI